MQRHSINQNIDSHQCFFITNGEDIHHIKNVMRNTVDNKIIIDFSDKKIFISEITNINSNQIEVLPINQLDIDTELPVGVTACSGLIKADRYEWLLRKSTGLGANYLISVGMDRPVVKLQENKVQEKIDRWQKIVKEAAEQSYRLVIPNVKFQSNLKVIYDTINNCDYVLIVYEDEAKHGEKSRFRDILNNFQTNGRMLAIFEPEGGFSDEETDLFREVSSNVGSGPRILRAETALLYAPSAISFEKELIG